MKVFGTITSAGATTSNTTTAVPFSLPTKFYAQCNKDCYVNQGATATSADDVYPQYAIIDVDTNGGQLPTISMVAVDGTAATMKCSLK